MSRLRAFNASLRVFDEAAAAIEARLADAWAVEVRRLARLAVANLERHQPITAAGEGGWSMPNEDEILHVATEVAAAADRMEVHRRAARAELVKIGADSGISFDVRNRIVDRVLEMRGQHITSIVETVRSEIMTQLVEAYKAGESLPKAAKRVSSTMLGASKRRGQVIAATELAGAKNGASVLLASVLDGTSVGPDGRVRHDLSGSDPMRLWKVWVATADRRTRPSHAAANQQTVPIKEAFRVGGAHLQYPGDPSGPGAEVIQCRCAVTYTEQAIVAAGGSTMGKVTFRPREMTLAVEETEEDAPLEPGAAFTCVLCVEGIETADMRKMAPDSLSWRDLPLTMMAMIETSAGGHMGAEVCGRIDTIERVGDEILGTGVFDTGEYGQEIQRLVANQTLKGVSVDLAIDEVEFEEPDGYDGEPMDEIDLFFSGVMVVTKGTILGATICPFPAFAEAQIVTAAGEPVRLVTHRWLEFVNDDGSRTMSGRDVGVGVECLPDGTEYVLEGGDGITASAAGLVPVHPPAAWFETPEADAPTPLTVTDDGHVFGHIATWGTCHIGLPGCTTPPKSASGYAYFHTGEVVTEEGTRVAAGKITLGTGHAGLSLSRVQAAEHYDHTGTVVVDIRVVDGVHGAWACGALRPDVDAARVRELRAAPPSGDWRPVNGRLELVGVLAVNVPGFPVPRQRALAASSGDGQYETMALIAAGVVTPDRAEAGRKRLAELRAKAVYARDMERFAARAHG